jgi:hypothetical protein
MKDQLTNIESLLSTRATDKSDKEQKQMYSLLMQFFVDHPVGDYTARYSDGRQQLGIPIDYIYGRLDPKTNHFKDDDAEWKQAVENFVKAFNTFARLWSKKRQQLLLKDMAKSLISHVNAIETVCLDGFAASPKPDTVT